MATRDADPLLAYQFSVEVTEGLMGLYLPFKIPIHGFFTEVSGLDVEWETTEYKTTNLLGFPMTNQMVLHPVYSPITLRRGITDSEGFWLWHQLLRFGAKPLLKAYVTIRMYNRAYEEVAAWDIEEAWPSKITGPQIKSDSSDFVIEEMTLMHTGITRSYNNLIFAAIDQMVQLLIP